jgi:hypothetical protein
MNERSPHFLRTVSGCGKRGAFGAVSGSATTRALMLLAALMLFVCALMAAFQEPARSASPHGKSVQVPCGKCHAPGGFSPIRSSPDFDHAATGFPLKAGHSGIGCRDCHVKLVFSDTGTRCADCHADIHRRRHGADCQECHTTRGWDAILKKVDAHTNRFPLFGAHAALQCEDCHKGAAVGQFRGLATDCDSCHHDDYLKAESVDHQAAGFPLSCEMCHNMDGWLAGFNHGGSTGFVLSGAHTSLDCRDCHTNLVFAGTPADCIGCHAPEYDATAEPNHALAAFPRDCSLCHSSLTWMQAAFSHGGTAFQLTGAHTGLQCLDCHSSGQYAGLPADCYACHAAAYSGTTDPAHAAAGFPHDCAQCHSTAGWPGAQFTHSYFPIYSGRHTTVWSACSDCHTNSGNYAVFTCTICHTKTATDSHHSEVRGYVYNSANCYACHPTGRSGD